MNELNDYYGYNLATIEGESLDIGGCALTSPGLTDYDLNKTYEKLVTLMVDGAYIGFAGIVSAVKYICKAEKTKAITNITFWGDKDCMYSIKFRYLIGKEDAKELLYTEKDNQDFSTFKAKKDCLSRVMGHKLQRSINKYQINYKPFNY